MPQFQILEPAPDFGSMLGQQLGTGVSQGLQSSLEQFHKQKEFDKRQTAFKKAKLPEEWAAFPDPIVTQLLKNQQNEQALSAYNQSLTNSIFPDTNIVQQSPQNLQEQDQQSLSLSPQGNIKETNKFEETVSPQKKETKPILASQQLPPPTNAAQIQQHAQSRIQAKQQGFQQNKKYIEETDSEAKKAREIRPLIKRAAQLAKKGEVGSLKGYAESKLGEKIKFFKSPSVGEFQRIQKEMTVQNFRNDFGARPAATEFFYIQDVYPDVADTKDAILRKLVLEDWKAEIKEKRDEIKNDIYQKYGEYPLNLSAMVEERLQPVYDKYLEKTGYNKWEKEQQKAKPVSEEIMREYLRKNNNDPDKALEALQKDNYKIIE